MAPLGRGCWSLKQQQQWQQICVVRCAVMCCGQISQKCDCWLYVVVYCHGAGREAVCCSQSQGFRVWPQLEVPRLCTCHHYGTHEINHALATFVLSFKLLQLAGNCSCVGGLHCNDCSATHTSTLSHTCCAVAECLHD